MCRIVWTLFFLSSVNLASAGSLNPGDTSRGSEKNEIPVSGGSFVKKGITETCIIPRAFPGLKEELGTGVQPEKAKKQSMLCGLDFYNDPLVASCPKLWSTNPGIDIHSLPLGADGKLSMSKARYIENECPKIKNRAGDKVAKFKQSISCSYTPSILGYFQLSQVLGGAANVPASVIRTMRRDIHLKYTESAVKFSAGEYIHSLWLGYLDFHRNYSSMPAKRARLLIWDDSQIYGALIADPKKDEKYNPLPGEGEEQRLNIPRTKRDSFKNMPAFMELRESAPLARSTSRDFDLQTVQKIQRMKDISEMVLLDHILEQEDRFGNIHYQLHYALMQNGKLTLTPKKEADAEKMKDAGALLIKRMILQDNDCGVAEERDNIARSLGLLKLIRHLDPETYRRTLWLAGKIKQPETAQYFQKELLFTQGDFKRISTNIIEAAAILKSACKAGQLNLDLSIERQVSGKNLTDSTSLCAP